VTRPRRKGRHRRPHVEPPWPGFLPISVLDIELSTPLPDIPAVSGDRRRAQALILVRVHGVPAAQVDVDLGNDGLSKTDLARLIWESAGADISRHLVADALAAPRSLPPGGLTTLIPPQCVLDRQAALASPPLVSVIIPTRDRPEHIDACLDAVLRCSYPRECLEVLVVDNASVDDRTAQAVASYAAAGSVRYLREERSGSASARNRALPEARGTILLFTDDDGVPDVNWIVETVRGFAAAPDVAAVSGLLLPRELNTPAQVWFEQYGGFSRGFQRRIFDLGPNRPANQPLYPFSAGIFGTGNNMAFRAEVLRSIGGFDPGLGNGTPALGGVDSEALLRTVLLGYRLVYQPTSLVSHSHRADYAGLHRQVYSYGAGLTAYLLKTVTTNPAVLPALIARMPRGLRFALSSESAKNSAKRANYPRELTRAELRGMIYGPLAYWRSRRAYGPHAVPRVSAGH
jgi:glycosyltransferase involved in cell wall biosynthesis